jgi:hypothetical protein
MRKALVAMVLVMALAVSAHAGSVYLVPSAVTVATGATFTVDMVVSGAGAPGAEACNVEVTFNPALVTVLGASEGGFYSSQQGSELYMEIGKLLDNTNGLLSYTFARLGPLLSTGSGTAAVLTFQCKDYGLTTLSYYVGLGEPEGGVLLEGTGSVAVNQGPIPEPMTLVLIGAALTALGLVARKRS